MSTHNEERTFWLRKEIIGITDQLCENKRNCTTFQMSLVLRDDRRVIDTELGTRLIERLCNVARELAEMEGKA